MHLAVDLDTGPGLGAQGNAGRFAAMVPCLTGGEMPRVWSFLVTVFGDLARAPGQELPGVLLTRVTGAVGIKPEACRVALHRLRKEGWIANRRKGRQSIYRLTDRGLAQSDAASAKIYSDHPAETAALLVCDPQDPSVCDGIGVQLRPGLSVATDPPPGAGPDSGLFTVPLDLARPLPDWMRDRVVPPELTELSQVVAFRFARLAEMLQQGHALTPFQIAVLRILIVHNWRRVRLKAPDLPDAVFPHGWMGPECRTLSSLLLTRLPPPALEAIETSP